MKRAAKTPAKRKKTHPPPSVEPYGCVALVVDTAERSGWALYIRGKLDFWGEVDMLRPERSVDRDGLSGWNADRVCMHALIECADQLELPAVLVYERPFRGTTQGQYIGSWKQSWLLNGGNPRRVLGVYPSTWRARVLGAGNMTRDNARRVEHVAAQGVAGRLIDAAKMADACAAIAMGQWAIRAGEVGARLPKKLKRKVA